MLLTDGQYEKNTNPKYNQDDFLDDLIKKEIPGSDIKGDVAIIGGEYAYELDRSVPKIGKHLGNPKKLVWPEVVIVNEPTEFTGNCLSNRIVTGGDDTMTGIYYLWVMFKTSTGKINICGSNGFNFDNEGPEIISFTTKAYSEGGITLTANAQDIETGTAKFKFYVDEILVYTEDVDITKEQSNSSFLVKNLNMGYHDCRVEIFDGLGNVSFSNLKGKTMMYAWEKHNITYTSKKDYAYVRTRYNESIGGEAWPNLYSNYSLVRK